MRAKDSGRTPEPGDKNFDYQSLGAWGREWLVGLTSQAEYLTGALHCVAVVVKSLGPDVPKLWAEGPVVGPFEECCSSVVS